MPDARDASAFRELLESVLEEGVSGGEPIVAPPRAIELVRQALRAALTEVTLIEIVETILTTAHYLEAEYGSPTAASALVDLVERDEVLDALRAAVRAHDTPPSAEEG